MNKKWKPFCCFAVFLARVTFHKTKNAFSFEKTFKTSPGRRQVLSHSPVWSHLDLLSAAANTNTGPLLGKLLSFSPAVWEIHSHYSTFSDTYALRYSLFVRSELQLICYSAVLLSSPDSEQHLLLCQVSVRVQDRVRCVRRPRPAGGLPVCLPAQPQHRPPHLHPQPLDPLLHLLREGRVRQSIRPNSEYYYPNIVHS